MTEEEAGFVRHIAVDVRTDDDGTVIGDRITVKITRDDLGDKVRIMREDKLIHPTTATDPDKMDWDWSVDPDCGITTTFKGAKELYDALRDGLPEDVIVDEDERKAHEYFARIDKGVKDTLAANAAALAEALNDCVIDDFHKDLCGVCKKHLVDCDKEFVYHDWPPQEDDKELACTGAKARVLLRRLDLANVLIARKP